MSASIIEKIKGFTDRVPQDVVGLDCSSGATHAVRMRKQGAGAGITAVALLPAVPLIRVMKDAGVALNKAIEVISVPLRVRGRYAALSAPGMQSSIKILRVPESFDLENRQQLLQRLGYEQAEGQRVATYILQPASNRSEARILVAAIPDRLALALLECLPSAGLPAPRSIGLSELYVVNAFCQDSLLERSEQTYAFIHFDHDFTVTALFNNGIISQLRTFALGTAAVLRKVSATLNVDEETAAGILLDGAFDLSHLIEEESAEVRGQYVISRDFMERSENCHLQALYCSGAPALVDSFLEGAHLSEKVIHWDVAAGYRELAEEGVPEEWGREAWRWTAAIGACLGVLSKA